MGIDIDLEAAGELSASLAQLEELKAKVAEAKKDSDKKTLAWDRVNASLNAANAVLASLREKQGEVEHNITLLRRKRGVVYYKSISSMLMCDHGKWYRMQRSRGSSRFQWVTTSCQMHYVGAEISYDHLLSCYGLVDPPAPEGAAEPASPVLQYFHLDGEFYRIQGENVQQWEGNGWAASFKKPALLKEKGEKLTQYELLRCMRILD